MKQNKKVFVTGIGVISPIGIGKDEFWNSLEKKIDGSLIDEELLKTGIKSEKTCRAKCENLNSILGSYNFKRFSKYMQFTIGGIELAIKDANIDLHEFDEYSKGLIFNTVRGSYESTENFLHTLLTKGPEYVSPLKFPQTVTNAPATQISVKYKLKGCSTVLQGSSAVILAYNLIKNDSADLIICGGVDVISSMDSLIASSNENVLATKADNLVEASRPADVRRNGIIHGEASAFIILENEESVRKRKAFVYSEIIGCGAAYDLEAIRIFTRRDPNIIVQTIESALMNSNITTSQIDYINSMANSSIDVDCAEATAIKKIFKVNNIPIGNYKGATGEVFGASETLGIIQSSLTLSKNSILPITNLTEIDPKLNLNYVMQNDLSTEKLEYALSNSLEIGGNSSSIVLKKV
jgi:3-oxoacyl-[acyl-carrier-protein] synthase II